MTVAPTLTNSVGESSPQEGLSRHSVGRNLEGTGTPRRSFGTRALRLSNYGSLPNGSATVRCGFPFDRYPLGCPPACLSLWPEIWVQLYYSTRRAQTGQSDPLGSAKRRSPARRPRSCVFAPVYSTTTGRVPHSARPSVKPCCRSTDTETPGNPPTKAGSRYPCPTRCRAADRPACSSSRQVTSVPGIRRSLCANSITGTFMEARSFTIAPWPSSSHDRWPTALRGRGYPLHRAWHAG